MREEDSVMMMNGGKSKEGGNHKKRKNQQVTSSNAVLKRLLRPARYFDGGIMTNRCFNPNKPRRRPCLLCASVQHVTKHCSVKHEDKDCSDKASVCLRCGGLGHDMGLCKYEYSVDDLKSVLCYVCKRFGHMCCVEPCDSSSSLWAVSCYRCGELGHTGLSCGRYFEGSPEIESGVGRVKDAEKKKKRLEKGLTTSAAVRSELEKKKKQRLDEEGVAVAIHDSTPHESNGTMTKKKKKKRKKKKNNKNSELHVTAHESNGEKSNGNLDQRSTLHESNGKTKKNNVESEPSCTAHESNRKRKKNKKAKCEQPPIGEKPSGWITEDLEENPFHRGKIRRLSSATTLSGHGHHILHVSPPGHNHRLPTTHMGHNCGSPRFVSGGHYPGSHSTTPDDRNRTSSSFEYNGHLWDPPPSRSWQGNYPLTSPIAPVGHSHHRLPVTPPGYNHRSPTYSSAGHDGGNRRYSSLESNRHLMDPPFSRLRQSYYSPTSPIAPSGHNHHLLPVTPQGHNHRLPTFSYGEHHTGSLSTIQPYGGNHRDSSFEYNERHLDPPFSRWQPYYHPTSPITPPGHNHHMLPSTYNGRNQRSPTFNSGGHYSSPMSSPRYGGNHRNSPLEADGHLLGPSTSRWHPYYPPTSSHHHHHQQNIYGHAPSRYGPPHHYGEFSGNYERW